MCPPPSAGGTIFQKLCVLRIACVPAKAAATWSVRTRVRSAGTGSGPLQQLGQKWFLKCAFDGTKPGVQCAEVSSSSAPQQRSFPASCMYATSLASARS